LKIMADLDIAEKRLPQDGRISLRLGQRAIDVRVSTLPSAHGERAVLRLLDKSESRLTLEAVGMQGHTLQGFTQLLSQPHGIVLVTGPTGSGKTTTLYAALQGLDASRNNIMTVEDPIEYELAGVGQTQVNPKIDLDFAKALRAILRQDPDIIMIGEIRDHETAQIAIQASLTGHLVLATLHTRSATQAIERLVDVFPGDTKALVRQQLSLSLLGVVHQVLCKSVDGTRRVAAHEVLFASPAVRQMIRDNKATQLPNALQTGAQHGMRTLAQSLAQYVAQGVITAEEAQHHADG
jgi:general secretion pathway protein E